MRAGKSDGNGWGSQADCKHFASALHCNRFASCRRGGGFLLGGRRAKALGEPAGAKGAARARPPSCCVSFRLRPLARAGRRRNTFARRAASDRAAAAAAPRSLPPSPFPAAQHCSRLPLPSSRAPAVQALWGDMRAGGKRAGELRKEYLETGIAEVEQMREKF